MLTPSGGMAPIISRMHKPPPSRRSSERFREKLLRLLPPTPLGEWGWPCTAPTPCPNSCYRRGFRAVQVFEGDAWHGTNRTHIMMRCDVVAFCARRRATSSGNRTKVLRDPCNPKETLANHKSYSLRHLMLGECPYRERHTWVSGLDGKMRCPPCKSGHMKKTSFTTRSVAVTPAAPRYGPDR